MSTIEHGVETVEKYDNIYHIKRSNNSKRIAPEV